MATVFTSHYNLDKYTGEDKPNLRDQYNAAMDKIDAQLWSNEQDVADVKQTNTELRQNVLTLQTDMTQAKSDIATLQQTDETQNANIATLQSDITQAKNDIESLKSVDETQNTSIASLQSDMTQAKSDIGELETASATTSGNVGTLQTDMTQAKSDIAALQASDTEQNGEIDTLQSDVSQVKNNVSQIEENIGTLENETGDNSANITSLSSKVADLTNDVKGMQRWEKIQYTLSDNVTPIFSNAGHIKINKEVGLIWFAIAVSVKTTITANGTILTLNNYSTGTTANYQYYCMIETKNTSTNEMSKANGFIGHNGNIGTYSQIANGFNVYIIGMFPCDDVGGDFEPGTVNAEETRNAICSLFKSWLGKFDYSQEYPGRLTPLTSGYTDCSASIYAAYNQAAGILLPTTGTPQIYGGSEIATATAGNLLDTSSLLPGDIIGYSTNGGEGYVHVVLYTGGGICWEMNEWTKGANAGKKGPQQVDYSDHNDSTADLAHYRMSQYRKVVRYIF